MHDKINEGEVIGSAGCEDMSGRGQGRVNGRLKYMVGDKTG